MWIGELEQTTEKVFKEEHELQLCNLEVQIYN